MKKKLQLVGQNNSFIQQTIYKELDINDLKIFKTIVSKVNYKNSLFDDFYIMDYSDLDLAGVKKDNRFHSITKSLKKLSNCFVTIQDKEENTIELGLITNKFIYKKHSSKIVIEIHDDLKPYLLDLKNKYTRYSLENIKKFDNVYILLIYELCKSWVAEGKIEISLQNLRDKLNLKKTQYKLYGNFKQKILQRALDIINETTDLQILLEEKKIGRSVDKLIFHIQDKYNDIIGNDIDITNLIDKVFIDKNSVKYLIMGYEQDPNNKNNFRFKVFGISAQKITYTEFMKKEKLYSSIVKMIRETEMIKRIK